MISRLTLRNFKSVGEQIYDFTQFDLLVGRNNSGKSTVLQALAIWQFCVDEFHRSKRSGSKGIQVILPNFTALPVPEFNLLWKDRDIRRSPNKKQEYILIGIYVEWQRPSGEMATFGVDLRYHSPQTIYAIPGGGWTQFRACEQMGDLPVIAYVPPFSGLEPTEMALDVSPIRQQVGKGQPGSVLRNLLLRVCPTGTGTVKLASLPPDWQELVGTVERWFSVTLTRPRYEDGKNIYIEVEYQKAKKKLDGSNGKGFDIIAGGSGFHQTLTLLAFLYGYQPTTILLDEPDAHLHVNLQRAVLDYFKKKSSEKGVQFLIATHAEEFANGVDPSQILSLLKQVPTLIDSTPQVLRAMADVSNEQITALLGAPNIVYVEGATDERILRAWAEQCGALTAIEKIHFKTMDGGDKKEMKRLAKEHFAALQQILPDVRYLMLFDFDSSEKAFHPPADNAVVEWHRKNVENYLLVPAAWKREALKVSRLADDLLSEHILSAIDRFFADENLTLPASKTWRNVSANIFKEVNGKWILFENDTSLFHTLRNGDPKVEVLRERVAAVMTSDEIHEDVHQFFRKLIAMVDPLH